MKALELWLEFLDEKHVGHCGLCGNSGVVNTHTANVKTPTGLKVGVKTYCICPNDRAMKKGKAII
jgi:hypothetical protein